MILNSDAIVLEQNAPNPFAENTIIPYNIPMEVKTAQIIFYDIAGRIIKVVDISERGKGRLNVFAGDLSSGQYTYTLITDGKVFETKKMTKTE